MGQREAGQDGAPVALDPVEPLRQLGVVVGDVHDRRQTRLAVRGAGIGPEELVGLGHAVVGEPRAPGRDTAARAPRTRSGSGTPAARRGPHRPGPAGRAAATARPARRAAAPRARAGTRRRRRWPPCRSTGASPADHGAGGRRPRRSSPRPAPRRHREGDDRVRVAQRQPRDHRQRPAAPPAARDARERPGAPAATTRASVATPGDSDRIDRSHIVTGVVSEKARSRRRPPRRGPSVRPRPWPPTRTARPSTATATGGLQVDVPLAVAADQLEHHAARRERRTPAHSSALVHPSAERVRKSACRSTVRAVRLPICHARTPAPTTAATRNATTAGRQQAGGPRLVGGRRGVVAVLVGAVDGPDARRPDQRCCPLTRASPRSLPIHGRDRTEGARTAAVREARRGRRGGRPRG